MQEHPFDNDFRVTPQHVEQFQRDGFVKLSGFFNPNVVRTLLNRVEVEMSRAPDNFKSEFSRLKYDFETEKTDIYELIAQPYFRKALTTLVQKDLFLTFELCFELEKKVSKGFPWHVGVQSFGYQVADEFGCTIWAALHPVRKSGQRGGMAYVPERVVSGRFIYDQIEPAIISTLEAKEQAGDVLVFNKYVVHRCIMLEDGPLPKRAAFVMRFVEDGSHYDLQRARNLEYPAEKYGHKAFTRSHMEIGLPDGALLTDSEYFTDRDKRFVRRDLA